MYGANPKNIKRRFIVPPSLASWDEDFPDYKPIEYTNEIYCEPNRAVFADIEDCSQIEFNNWDEANKTDRYSYQSDNRVKIRVNDGRPLNPIGRTGVIGRGDLHLWGPTHALDPIITRWKNKHLKQLEFLAVKRQDGS